MVYCHNDLCCISNFSVLKINLELQFMFCFLFILSLTGTENDETMKIMTSGLIKCRDDIVVITKSQCLSAQTSALTGNHAAKKIAIQM